MGSVKQFSCDKRIVNKTKNGKGNIELKVSNGFFEKNKKKIPEYLCFRCDMTHLNYSLKSLGRTFRLQKETLKTEIDHDEIDYSNHKDKK